MGHCDVAKRRLFESGIPILVAFVISFLIGNTAEVLRSVILGCGTRFSISK